MAQATFDLDASKFKAKAALVSRTFPGWKTRRAASASQLSTKVLAMVVGRSGKWTASFETVTTMGERASTK